MDTLTNSNDSRETDDLRHAAAPDLKAGPIRRAVAARLLAAKEELERTATQPLYMAHYAEIAGQRPLTFTRHFVRSFGVPPVRYRLELRIKEACRLLVHFPGLKIEVIANQAGFADVRFFRRAFRALRGMSPGEYRTSQSLRAA